MVRIFTAALFMALAAAPAAAQDGPSSSTSTSSSAGGTGMCREIAGSGGRICCDNCGGGLPAGDPVDVPAPPALLLFAAGAMALAARRRASPR